MDDLRATLVPETRFSLPTQPKRQSHAGPSFSFEPSNMVTGFGRSPPVSVLSHDSQHDIASSRSEDDGGVPGGILPMMPFFKSGRAASLDQLDGHQQPGAGSERPFKCDQCPESFNRNYDLKRHKRVHLTVKPFPCGHCESSFSRKDALKRHVLVKGCGRASKYEGDEGLSGWPSPAPRDDDIAHDSIEIPERNRRNSASPNPQHGVSGVAPAKLGRAQDENISDPAPHRSLQHALLSLTSKVDHLLEATRPSSPSTCNETISSLDRAQSLPPLQTTSDGQVRSNSTNPGLSTQEAQSPGDLTELPFNAAWRSLSVPIGTSFGQYDTERSPSISRASRNEDSPVTGSSGGIFGIFRLGKSSGFAKRPTDGRDDKDEGHNEKKPRKRQCRTATDRCPLPCIFHIGEPDAYHDHTMTYDHISELLRHLRTHDYHACSKCFTKFVTNEDKLEHDRSRGCVKSCCNTSCRLHRNVAREAEAACLCITGAEQQWHRLFKLQYPGLDAPTLAPSTTQKLNTHIESPLNTSNIQFGGDQAPVSLEGVAPTTEALHDDILDSPEWPRDTIDMDAFQLDPLSFASLAEPSRLDMQEALLTTLQGKVHLLEQRALAKPTDREKHLEIALGMAWQALCNNGCPEANTETPLWQILQIHAPSVISTSTAVPDASGKRWSAAATKASRPVDGNDIAASEWDTILGQNTGQAPQYYADSAYASNHRI